MSVILRVCALFCAILFSYYIYYIKRLTGDEFFDKVDIEPLESGNLSVGSHHHYGETG